MIPTFKAVWKFAQFFFWSGLLVPPQMVLMLFSRGKAAFILPHLWHWLIYRAFGIQVEIVGNPVRNEQTVYIANHVSYLDITAITAVLPVSFVAKREVASWPLFGLFAKLQQTAFISRSRQDAHTEKNTLKDWLTSGNSLVLFAEGTSSDGSTVLPFKSSLFGMVTDPGLATRPLIQPLTIELSETNGRTVETQKDRDMYAWHGDMTLVPHFWAFAKSKGAKVRLHFHAPFRVQEGSDRKELAQLCHRQVIGPLVPDSAEAA